MVQTKDSMDNDSRTGAYKRNAKLEQLLDELNELLGHVEDDQCRRFTRPRYPALFLVGGPRSGSTVFMQFIAGLGAFAYPTNLLSRFYRIPYIGAKIQLLLTHHDYNFKDEMLDIASSVNYQSDLGKTRGALQPNEFWHFWRRFIPNSEPAYLTPAEERMIDGAGFLSELAAIESVFNKPLAMKAIILEQNIPFLSSLFDSVLFVHLKRHPVFIIQSLLECREKFFGTREKWYSIKPRQYDELIKKDPISQVAGQVFYSMKAVEDGLNALEAKRTLTIDYTRFCENPEQVYQLFVKRYAEFGYAIKREYPGPVTFDTADKVRLSDGEIRQIINAYESFSGISISL